MSSPARHVNDPQGGYRLGAYHEPAVPAPLRGLVEAAWVYRAPASSPAPPTHRVLPETGVSVCVIAHCDSRGTMHDAELAVMGAIHTVRFFAPTPGIHMVGLRLKAECARWLLGVDPADHVDAIHPTATALRSPSFRNRLMRASDAGAVLRALFQAFEQRLPARPLTRSHAAVSRLLDDVRARPAAATPASPDRRGELSERQARRLARELTGSGIKYFSRVRRLLFAVSQADAVAAPHWARLAVATGYYDQAHMINEFRALTGASPRELHAERRAQWKGAAVPGA